MCNNFDKLYLKEQKHPPPIPMKHYLSSEEFMRFFFLLINPLSGAAFYTEALCYKLLGILVLKILTFFQKNRT